MVSLFFLFLLLDDEDTRDRVEVVHDRPEQQHDGIPGDDADGRRAQRLIGAVS
jgi:hypothetical protein